MKLQYVSAYALEKFTLISLTDESCWEVRVKTSFPIPILDFTV